MGNSVTAGFRLSAQQERVWAQRAGAAVSCAIQIQGSIDAVILQEALCRLVRRHEILRTVFHRQPGLKVPFQVIREFIEPVWSVVKASDGRVLLQKELDTAFDLESGPILRAALLQGEANSQILVLSLPALCADTRSLQNLVRDLSLEYTGTASMSEAMQYADVVEWQNELLESEDTRAGREYWRNYFRNLDLASVGLSLPFAGSTGPSRSDRYEVVLNDALKSRIEAACGAGEFSARDLFLTCWFALWSRLSGRREVTIGCSFDGRKYQELEDAIGVFANSIPIQSSISPEVHFDRLVDQIKQALSEAHSWQESFSWSKVESWPEPNNQLIPLAFDEYDISGTLGSFELQSVCSDLERHELKLVCVRGGRGLRLEFHYDAGRFSRSAVERIAGYFQTLLAAAVTAPETPVSRLPLLPEQERRKLLVEWNQTAAPYPQERCLHQLFEAQAARTPDRAALVFGEQTLSYAQWNEQANRLAHHLRSLGVGPDALVGLCLERSAEMMIAVLAILKAGGAYVPLNPDNPKPRLAQQLAGAVVLITESKLAAQMPAFSGHTLCLGRDEKLWASQPVTNPDTEASPDNLVYVIYTSGSTGVPKGVAVRHRNLVNYSHFITQRLGLANYADGLHFATVSTIGADLGNTCIFPAMISGGCLHVIPYEVSTDAQRFARYSQQHPIDVLKIVPSHLEALLHSSEAAQILPRKFLLTGGETLTPKLAETILALHPGCELFNHYGPTETTVGSLTLRLKDYDWKKAQAHSIPIGRPIANTQLYILDAHLEPVPEGVIGELYISGAGVTAGYLNQPEKTQERFLRNPFVTDPNARMYRTGDLARYLADGNVEFLGRSDDQVKIRGFRIELGEIEAVLAQHAGVKQAVVLAKADERGDKRLVAYVVAREASLSQDTLRAYLKEQLPEYMVPQAMVLLAKLPLNANGKIDRQALPEPEQVAAKAYVAPGTPTEQAVAQIWSEVLHRDRISTEDNFFDLGGHSLMATQVVSRIREKFRVELAMRILFEKPTIGGLAQAIQTAQSEGAEDEAPAIVRVSREAYRVRGS